METNLIEQAKAGRNEVAPFLTNTYTPEDRWTVSPGSNVFTVPPEQISPEEFAQYEARAVAFLEDNLDIHEVKKPEEDPWAQLTRVPAAAEPRSRPRRALPAPKKVRRRPSKHEILVTALTLLTVLLMFGLLIGATVFFGGA